MTALDLIRPFHPSDDFAAWLAEGAYPDLQAAWAACPRADWLLWLAGQGREVDYVSIARATAALARAVLPAFENACPDDARPRLAVEVAEALVAATATLARARAAIADAHAAAVEVAADTVRISSIDARSASASASCAASACEAIVRIHGINAWGIEETAWFAADAVDPSGAGAVAHFQHADIVRRFLPAPPNIPAPPELL